MSFFPDGKMRVSQSGCRPLPGGQMECDAQTGAGRIFMILPAPVSDCAQCSELSWRGVRFGFSLLFSVFFLSALLFQPCRGIFGPFPGLLRVRRKVIRIRAEPIFIGQIRRFLPEKILLRIRIRAFCHQGSPVLPAHRRGLTAGFVCREQFRRLMREAILSRIIRFCCPKQGSPALFSEGIREVIKTFLCRQI